MGVCKVSKWDKKASNIRTKRHNRSKNNNKKVSLQTFLKKFVLMRQRGMPTVKPSIAPLKSKYKYKIRESFESLKFKTKKNLKQWKKKKKKLRRSWVDNICLGDHGYESNWLEETAVSWAIALAKVTDVYIYRYKIDLKKWINKVKIDTGY